MFDSLNETMNYKGLLIITTLIISCSSPNHESKMKAGDVKSIKNNSSDTLRNVKVEKQIPNETSVENDITVEFCEKWDISASFDSSYYGAFGKNYQRIDLIIDSIIKTINPSVYSIWGSTILKGKEVNYVGELRITSVEQSEYDLYGFQSGSKETTIFANYELIEDKSVSGSGVFNGDFILTIHQNQDGSLDYNTFDWMQDGYSNYIFDGIWLSAKNNKYKTYFADGKLEVGDLNVGAGGFVPNEKYVQYGWQSYMDEYFPMTE